MKVISHNGGFDIKQPLEVLDAFRVGTQGFQVFQIANMVTDEGIVIAGKAESILEFCAARQQLLVKLECCSDWLRCVTARPAQDHFTAVMNARDGIIRSYVNAPVVQQKIVCNLV